MIMGLDADQDLTPFIPAMKASRIAFVNRYLKNLSPEEYAALTRAGILVGAIFETTAQRALQGAKAGQIDGMNIPGMMSAIGFQKGAAALLTVDDDVGPADISLVEGYYQAATTASNGWFVPGLYGSGFVLSSVKPTIPWLAGAMGWQGSRAYTGWRLMQGPPLTHGGQWNGITWPDLGFEYDPDVALDASWLVAGSTPNPVPPVPTPADNPVIQDVKALQGALAAVGLYHGTIDGDWGPLSQAAMTAWRHCQ